ncbi:MAG: phosphotransferase [Gemmatimonadaceae bacterium]|nr:phosphotransferase [Gemmatimonadaceae bacterium]
MIPTDVLRAARAGFGLPRGHVRVLSTRFAKTCLAHRTADGGRSQLRLVQAGADTLPRLHSEMQWLQHLARTHGIAVPAPHSWRDGALVSPLLTDRHGGTWHAVQCAWVTGRHLDRGFRPADFARAGALLARLHRANADAPAGIAAARPTWWIPRLFELATSLRHIVLDEMAPLPPSVSPALAQAYRRAHAALVQAAAALPRGAHHEGLVHTDAHWQNLRFTRERVGLVDFEDFASGRYMLDVACLWGRVQERTGSARMLDAILEGYDRVRPLPPSHHRDLRVMLAFRRFDYAGWVLSWPDPSQRDWGPALLAGAPAYIERMLGG